MSVAFLLASFSRCAEPTYYLLGVVTIALLWITALSLLHIVGQRQEGRRTTRKCEEGDVAESTGGFSERSDKKNLARLEDRARREDFTREPRRNGRSRLIRKNSVSIFFREEVTPLHDGDAEEQQGQTSVLYLQVPRFFEPSQPRC